MSAGVEGFFGLVGATLNEDQGTFFLHCTPAAEGFFKDRLLVTDDAAIGQLRAHVNNKRSLEYANQLQAAKQAVQPSSGTPGPSTAQLSISTHAPPSMVSKSKARAKSSSASSVSSVRTSKSRAGSTRVKAEPSDGHKMPRASGKTKGDEMTTLRGSVHSKLVPWFGAAGISIGKTIQWLQLPGILADAGLTVVDWAFGVPFFGESRRASSKKSGIRDIGVDAMRDIVSSFDQHNPPRFVARKVTDIKAGRVPLFLEAAPPHDSTQARGRQKFFNGTIDYSGPLRQLPFVPAPQTPPQHASPKSQGEDTPEDVTVRQRRRRRNVVQSDDDDKPLAPQPSAASVWAQKRGLEIIRASANLPPVLFKDNDHDRNFTPSESDQDTPRPRRKKRASSPAFVDPGSDDDNRLSQGSEPSPTRPPRSVGPSRAKSALPDSRTPSTSTSVRKLHRADPLQLFTPTPKKIVRTVTNDPYTLILESIADIPPPPDPSLPLASRTGSSFDSARRLVNAQPPPFPSFLQNFARSPSPAVAKSTPVSEPYGQAQTLHSYSSAPPPTVPFAYQSQAQVPTPPASAPFTAGPAPAISFPSAPPAAASAPFTTGPVPAVSFPSAPPAAASAPFTAGPVPAVSFP
ncbi:hypothetical protein FA15DRAFT_704325, partial [Coprinopsis marcescibilis]